MFALSADSWMKVTPDAVACTSDEFAEFWGLCPTTKDHIKMYGKEHPLPRFQRLYGEAKYKFSGIQLEPTAEIPEIVERCLAHARETYPDGNWNGALVNWYADGESYISPHSDDERDLNPGMPILSFSFGSERDFVVDAIGKQDVKKIILPTRDRSCIIMGGNMQKKFKHGIPKTKEKVGPRINVTVRSFGTTGGKRQKMSSE